MASNIIFTDEGAQVKIQWSDGQSRTLFANKTDYQVLRTGDSFELLPKSGGVIIGQFVNADLDTPEASANALETALVALFNVEAGTAVTVAGVSTAANQTTGNNSLSSIDGKLTNQATAAIQATQQTALNLINTKLGDVNDTDTAIGATEAVRLAVVALNGLIGAADGDDGDGVNYYLKNAYASLLTISGNTAPLANQPIDQALSLVGEQVGTPIGIGGANTISAQFSTVTTDTGDLNTVTLEGTIDNINWVVLDTAAGIADVAGTIITYRVSDTIYAYCRVGLAIAGSGGKTTELSGRIIGYK